MWEEITGGEDELMVGKRPVPSRAYVSWFNFKGAQQQRKVGTLSGGERNRVHLAKLLQRGSNLLLLDEPTNDLDVDTLRALEEALLNYAGCAVVISHDRWFLDRIATHMLAFEGDSRVVWFEGNYQDYEADRQRRLGAEADTPHRIKYRKLTVDRSRRAVMNAEQAKFLAEFYADCAGRGDPGHAAKVLAAARRRTTATTSRTRSRAPRGSWRRIWRPPTSGSSTASSTARSTWIRKARSRTRPSLKDGNAIVAFYKTSFREAEGAARDAGATS